MILYEQNLVNKIRELADNTQKRIRIVSPFIGSWSAIEKILGRKWITDTNIEIKLLTDIRNENLIDVDSINEFRHRADIRTLSGLHAKIYIFDNSAVISSANLTGTAFSKRYEIGIVDNTVLSELENLFNSWWNKAQKVDSLWHPNKLKKHSKGNDDINSENLKSLWRLPSLPLNISVFKDYGKLLNAYRHFKGIYFSVTISILPKVPRYQEVDAFFNFLFHEHPNTPTKIYKKSAFRQLSDNKRKKEVAKYSKQFKSWINAKPNRENYRLDRIKTIQSLLSASRINSLIENDVAKVISSLHCMNSLKLNQTRFLNPNNNSLSAIISNWEKLLHDQNKTIEERMEESKRNLSFFGKSAIRELIGWYYPNDYPIVNTNSNCGMKFFGYDIETY